MESIEKTLIVFVHGTMDNKSGTGEHGCDINLEQYEELSAGRVI